MKKGMLLIAYLLLLNQVFAETIISDTFDTDGASWLIESLDPTDYFETIVFTVPVEWKSDTGNPGGAIEYNEQHDWNWDEMFKAPQRYVSAARGHLDTVLEYEMLSSHVSEWGRVVISANGKWATSTIGNTATSWESYTINFSEADWFTPNGTSISDTELGEIIRSLDAIYIEADHTSGLNWSKLDNVVLTVSGVIKCGDIGTILLADLNYDCYVNLEDLALLANQWLECTDPENVDCN